MVATDWNSDKVSDDSEHQDPEVLGIYTTDRVPRYQKQRGEMVAADWDSNNDKGVTVIKLEGSVCGKF
jgi:hypothetical protein